MSSTLIPSQHLYYPTKVNGSPFNVESTCPFGYSGLNSSSPYLCKEVYDDGYRVGDEECDDGNIYSNYG